MRLTPETVIEKHVDAEGVTTETHLKTDGKHTLQIRKDKDGKTLEEVHSDDPEVIAKNEKEAADAKKPDDKKEDENPLKPFEQNVRVSSEQPKPTPPIEDEKPAEDKKD